MSSQRPKDMDIHIRPNGGQIKQVSITKINLPYETYPYDNRSVKTQPQINKMDRVNHVIRSVIDVYCQNLISLMLYICVQLNTTNS